MFHVSQLCIQLSLPWHLLSISEFKHGRREDSLPPAIPCRNPKPGCAPRPDQPHPHNSTAPKMPRPSVNASIPVKLQGVSNYNSQSPLGPRRGRTSWLSPALGNSPGIPVSSLPGVTPSQHTPRDYTLSKEVSGCTLFPEPIPHPHSQAWLFSS